MFFENHLFTKHQLKIIELYANGSSRAEVADALGYSRETIRKQEVEIVERFYTKNITHVVAIATKLGLVEVSVYSEFSKIHTKEFYSAKNTLHHQVTARIKSRRQLEIFWLLGDGLSNEKIAKQLGITIDTVRTHLRRIYKELDGISPQPPDGQQWSNEEKRNEFVKLSISFRRENSQGDS